MKRFLKKLIYGALPVTEYSSITLTNISEKMWLKSGQSLIDISGIQWALCLQPVIIGIWLDKSISHSFAGSNNFTLLIEEKTIQKKLVEIKALFFDNIEEQDGIFLLVKVSKCRLFHTSFMETFSLYHYYYRKTGFSFSKFKSYVAVFSFPRKVRIVSFQTDDYYSIFPMDFAGNIAGTNRWVFGLRHSNQALSQIIRTSKLVVSEIPFTHKDDIYRLGSYHRSVAPPLEQLSFKTLKSKNFEFPVPEFSERYSEITIIRTINLGSHMLLWGESAHEEIRNRGEGNLYHIHFLLDLFLARQGKSYIRL